LETIFQKFAVINLTLLRLINTNPANYHE